MVLAMSVQWGEERASAGAVVKPTWLLMITCIVPPVVKPAQELLYCQHQYGQTHNVHVSHHLTTMLVLLSK